MGSRMPSICRSRNPSDAGEMLREDVTAEERDEQRFRSKLGPITSRMVQSAEGGRPQSGDPSPNALYEAQLPAPGAVEA